MRKSKRSRQRRKPHYRGLPLNQLLANLPNHGVGRLITRGSFKQNEEEPSYMRILEVASPNPAMQNYKKKGKTRIPVKVERIWRGVLFPRPVDITSTSYLPDFKLVPKEKEEILLKNTKTPREKGYVYWNAEQKRNIKALVAQGLSISEAKQKEKERIFREEAEAAARDGTAGPQETTGFDSSAIMFDNFGEDDEDGDEDEHDSNESFDSDCAPEEMVIRRSYLEDKRYDISNRSQKNIVTSQRSYYVEAVPDDISFDHFTEEQKQRVEDMIKRGVNIETAQQLEWERQIAFERAAADEYNNMV